MHSTTRLSCGWNPSREGTAATRPVGPRSFSAGEAAVFVMATRVDRIDRGCRPALAARWMNSGRGTTPPVDRTVHEQLRGDHRHSRSGCSRQRYRRRSTRPSSAGTPSARSRASCSAARWWAGRPSARSTRCQLVDFLREFCSRTRPTSPRRRRSRPRRDIPVGRHPVRAGWRPRCPGSAPPAPCPRPDPARPTGRRPRAGRLPGPPLASTTMASIAVTGGSGKLGRAVVADSARTRT